MEEILHRGIMVESEKKIGNRNYSELSGTEKDTYIERAEKIAIEYSQKQTCLVHERLNFWLITEGLLLAAVGAVLSSASVDNEMRFSVVLLLSFGGILLTILWHSIVERARSWGDWYFTRLQTIHRETYLTPVDKEDRKTMGVFPDKEQFSYWNGDGISVNCGSSIHAILFSTVWSLLIVISVYQVPAFEDYRFITTVFLILFNIAYFYLLFIQTILAHYRKRKEKKQVQLP